MVNFRNRFIERALRITVVMPPTLKKIEGHIALGLSVGPSVCPFIFLVGVLKSHILIPHQKIADPYFFSLNYLLLWSNAPFKRSE